MEIMLPRNCIFYRLFFWKPNLLELFGIFMQVRLIGYCTEVSLFLVYEFIENGNLSEHLRGLGKTLCKYGYSYFLPVKF